MKNINKKIAQQINRRAFLGGASIGLGGIALSSLLNGSKGFAKTQPGRLNNPHLIPKAKRVIYLFQSGGPSQLETWDYKPKLQDLNGQNLPDSIRQGQRLTGMSAEQSSLPMAGSQFQFQQYGQSGTWVSDLMPYTGQIVDDLCFIKSMHTEAINHDPAITFFQTGSQQAGRPGIGAWVNYGLGTDNDNLPAFIVMVSNAGHGQPIYARLWGNAFLPSMHQGVQFRSGVNPVLYLEDPTGIEKTDRRRMIDYLAKLSKVQFDAHGDNEINQRIAQYEMAYRMQTSVPEAVDVTKEPDYVFDMYGPDARKPGTYAANCILARRLAERGVKFIQLYHQGWDQHDNLPKGIQNQCRQTDQASAALVMDLKQRGLLEDTLVVWGGEFGRTNYSQGKLTKTNYGRDHHPRCFTMWMAGGGVKKGMVYGETDELGYNIVQNPVHVHDFQATLLHLMGIDHEALTYKHQGRRYRLTDVHGKVINDIIA